MNGLRHELRLFFIALQFFTRVPVPRWVGYTPEWMHQSARHYPVVGLVVGAWVAAVLALGHLLFTPTVAAWLALAAGVVLTGAFHEDGWADTCDGLGGAVDRERALTIMKDSRIGAYGAIGLVLMLGLKAATLAALPLFWAVPALLLAHATSRAAPVLLIRTLVYAGDLEHAKAKPMAQQVSRAGVAVALGWVLEAASALVVWRPALGAAVLASLGVAALATWAWARLLRRRLGGYTGDTLGAAQQLVEVLMLLVWLAIPRWVQ